MERTERKRTRCPTLPTTLYFQHKNANRDDLPSQGAFVKMYTYNMGLKSNLNIKIKQKTKSFYIAPSDVSILFKSPVPPPEGSGEVLLGDAPHYLPSQLQCVAFCVSGRPASSFFAMGTRRWLLMADLKLVQMQESSGSPQQLFSPAQWK